MSMPIVDWEVHYNPTGIKDVMSKLRTFALANGWTSVEYLTDVEWADDSGWDWQTGGDEDWLWLRTTGFGSAQYNFAFRASPDATDSTTDNLYPLGIYYGQTYAATSTTPHLQSAFRYTPDAGAFRYVPLPRSTFPAVYFFGNEQFIHISMQTLSNCFIHMAMGTVNLFTEYQNVIEDEGQCCWLSTVYLYTTQSDWANHDTYPNRRYWPYWNGGTGDYTYPLYWYSDARNADSMQTDISLSTAYNVDADDFARGFLNFRYVLKLNEFSGRRVMHCPNAFWANDLGEFEPVGKYWHTHLVWSGLSPGDSLYYGTERYVCLPCTRTQDDLGFAFRVE